MCLSVVGIGLSIALGDRARPDAGWPIAVIGVALTAGYAYVTMVLKRPGVLLDRDGFTVRRVFRTSRFSWNNVSDFTISTALPWRSMRHRYAVFDRVGDVGPWADVRRFLMGRARALPRGMEPAMFPGNTETVVMIMNAWRDRALATGARPQS